MSSRFEFLPLVAALLLGIGLACDGGSGRNWVAQVDSEPILLVTLQNFIQERAEQQPQVSSEDILNEELNRLVTEQVVLNRAQQLGVEVADEEVQERLRLLHGADFGKPDAEFLEEVRREMVLERTALVDLAGRIQPPESAVVLYFEENREHYNEPERVEIRQIVVEDHERAQRLRKELRDGAEFSVLAAEHSIAPEASEGGMLPPFARGEMPEVFETVFDIESGSLSDVVESPYGYHIFLLEQKIPARQAELDEVREQVLMELEQKRMEELKREWLRGLRRNAQVRLNEPLLETLR